MGTSAGNYLLLETFLSATFGTIFLLPIIIITYILNQSYRLLLSLLLKLFYKDEIILNPTGYDGMYSYFGHKHGKRTVLYLATLNDPIDLNEHRRNYEKHILSEQSYGKLRKIWIKKWGYHCLKEDLEFDISNHVRIYQSCGDNRVVSEKELMGSILPELSEDLGDSRPQWEDVIIPRFRYENGTEKSIRIFRIHHGYMDGISNLLMLAYSQSEGASFPWVIDPLDSSNKLTAKIGTFKSFIYYTLCALNFTGAIMKNIIFKPCNMRNRWHVRDFNGKTLHGWSSPLDMKMLREIRQTSKSSMPAVVCSILASAVRRYEMKFESTEKEFMGKLSEEIIVGLVAAELPYPDLQLRNHHCILKCHLDTGEFSSALERLQVIQNEMKRLSSLPDLYLNRLLPRLFGEMPGWFSDLCTALIGGSGVVSNFPAAGRKIKLWGNEVNEMAGWVPLLTPSGFACVTLRYADHLRFCINADTATMSQEQLDYFLDCIIKEAQLLAMEVSSLKLEAKAKSKVIGRFIVSKVENSVSSSFENNNSTSSYGKLIEQFKEYDSWRESRFNDTLNKVLGSVNKLKSS